MINEIRMGYTSMADMKAVVQDMISLLKHGRNGRLGRNYRKHFVEFILCKFQSCCHLLWIYRLIIGFKSIHGIRIRKIGLFNADFAADVNQNQ